MIDIAGRSMQGGKNYGECHFVGMDNFNYF